MPPKGKRLTFSDLGLSTPIPPALLKSRDQKKQEKVADKKAKKDRIAQAVQELSASRGVVERHRSYAVDLVAKENAEKMERKRSLLIEHVKAQNERKERERVEDQRALASQQDVVENIRAETQRAAEVAEAIRKEHDAYMAELAKVTPNNVHVAIHRVPAIAAQRSQLPVLREEQAIVEAVLSATRECVLICGETGSGKTTQVPQFLWECGFGHHVGKVFGREGMIAVTEPRRVAAVSMARRVAEELNVVFGEEVGYHVRYDHNISEKCRLKFVTEGILLREVQSDFLLRRYSAVVVDEAHERSVSGDLLIGLLSRIVPLRYDLFDEEMRRVGGDIEKTTIKPLKLVIMSATMRVADFRDNRGLFPHSPPLINVEARMFPVSIHFSKRTEVRNYVREAFAKVRQIHKKLPPGGILVFLSTQREIELLCRMLSEHYAKTRIYYDEEHYNKHSQLASRRGVEGSVAARSGAVPAPGQVNRGGDDDDDEDNGVGEACSPRKMRRSGSKRQGRGGPNQGPPPLSVEDEEVRLDQYGLADEEYALEDGDDSRTVAGGVAGTMSFVAPGARDDFDYRDVALSVLTRRKHPRLDGAGNDGDGGHPGGSPPLSSGKSQTRKVQAVEHATAYKAGERDFSGGSASDGEEEEEEEDSGRPDILVNGEDEDDGALDTLHVLPLYAMLDFNRQQEVFKPPPRGKRLCVVATNVAETSITIPNIRYVVDTGREKVKTMEEATGATKFEIGWTSQASSQQRSGRAGRTAPGHCYRLYSTAVFANIMKPHGMPEILRTPLESVVLLMKHIGIDHVGSFPFPTRPRESDVQKGLLHLSAIGALDKQREYRITPLGNTLVRYPIPPRFARMIVEAVRKATKARMKDFVQMIAAVYATTTTVFTTDASQFRRSPAQVPKAGCPSESVAQIDERYVLVRRLFHGGSDLLTALHAFGVFMRQPSGYNCSRHCLVQKSLREAKQLFFQLRGITLSIHEGADRVSPSHPVEGAAEDLPLPDTLDWDESDGSQNQFKIDACFAADGAPILSRDEEIQLRQLFAIGLIDQLARRATVHECRSYGVKYNDKRMAKVPYVVLSNKSIAFVHPSSSCSTIHPPPEFVAFSHLQQSVRSVDDGEGARMMMMGVTVYADRWLHEVGIRPDELAEANLGK